VILLGLYDAGKCHWKVAMTNWDSHLRPLIGVLVALKAVNPGVGRDMRLCDVNGVERPVLVVFGSPWVVWLYIDSGTYMLRGGYYASERITQPQAPAAVPVGRVGSSEAQLPGQIIALIHRTVREVSEQPANNYTWAGMIACLGGNEGTSRSFTGHYEELLAPLIKRKQLSPKGSKLFPTPTSVTAPAPESEHALTGPPFQKLAEHPEPPVAEAPILPPVPAPDTISSDGFVKPVLERPGLIPGIVGTAALLLAILPLDYSFYGLIRWAVFVSALWLVNIAAKQKAYFLLCCYIVSAVLWNPLVPFEFSRASWLVPDLMGAAVMAYGAYVLFLVRPGTGLSKPPKE
jgi:hypothetical protein